MPRVLLVDDQPKILRFLEVKLRLSGHEVMTASSGQEAVKLAETANPSIIVLDLVMPGMDGLEVLEKLRSFSNVPIIASSARSGYADKALSLGATRYLPKPFNPDELVALIDALAAAG
jgi:two-component system KDP operon response regulator KdpE